MIHSRPMKLGICLPNYGRPIEVHRMLEVVQRAEERGLDFGHDDQGQGLHSTRKADDKSLAQLHAEAAAGALGDAGLTRADVDGYFCAGDAPGLGGLSMADYMGLKVRHIDTTESGGSSYVIHVAHAAEAIVTGKCNVALITLAGRPPPQGTAAGPAAPRQ